MTEIRNKAKAELEKIKGITDVVVLNDDEISGGGKLVTAKLKKNGDDSWGWYYEKGDVAKTLFTGEEIAKFIANNVAPKTIKQSVLTVPFSELIRTIILGSMTVFFAVAVVGLVINQPDNKSIQVVSSLLGLTLGWFLGKGESKAH